MSAFLPVLLLLLVLTLAFLLGSIPWGIIVSRLFYRTDIRQHGSGNIGTTNAMRTLGKRGGSVVFLLDFGKGLLAGLLGWIIALWLLPLVGPTQELWLHQGDLVAAAFVGCVLGHIFTPWLLFRGGKGIAVAAGCLLFTVGWLGLVIELLVFAALVLLTRYVSLGSVMAAIICPFLALWLLWGDWLAVVLCAITGALIIWAHRGNIQRLLSGTEPRVGKKSSAGDSSSPEKG
ncbi:MAG: glycerol-3-phosphate 1-O-acyltransferase PlsY [Coriobacteriales bacterium]|jgi:glycerol-3-phosphate acyltransferase PlsY|nr:glycerol-3-phosphate 1-O-acyltransferase PlsY [Coriobacteriales bacterium]